MVSLENPGCISRDVIRTLCTCWMFVFVNSSPNEVPKQELKTMNVYSQNNLIITTETNKPIQVCSLLGVTIEYDKSKKFASGTYLVKVVNRVCKVIV